MKRVRGKLRRVHRLVLAEKLGRPIREGMYALHTCGRRWCVEASHLYEGTHQDNMDDMRAAGVAARSREALRKLTKVQVAEVRSRLANGEQGSTLAREFGVHKAQISRIKRGKSYLSTGTGPVV